MPMTLGARTILARDLTRRDLRRVETVVNNFREVLIETSTILAPGQVCLSTNLGSEDCWPSQLLMRLAREFPAIMQTQFDNYDMITGDPDCLRLSQYVFTSLVRSLRAAQTGLAVTLYIEQAAYIERRTCSDVKLELDPAREDRFILTNTFPHLEGRTRLVRPGLTGLEVYNILRDLPGDTKHVPQIDVKVEPKPYVQKFTARNLKLLDQG